MKQLDAVDKLRAVETQMESLARQRDFGGLTLRSIENDVTGAVGPTITYFFARGRIIVSDGVVTVEPFAQQP